MHAHAEHHAHAPTTEEVVLDGQGCGDGCGCGAAAEPLTPEVAAMRGFLSGVYASTLGRADLEQYLAAMAGQDSEFAPAAQFLGERLKALPASDEEGVPPAWDLLAAVSGEDEDSGDDELVDE